MASAPGPISLRYADFCDEFESDIADERREFNDAPNSFEIPSRPASRLGFNLMVPDHSSRMEAEPGDILVSGPGLETANWEDTDMEIISFSHSPDDKPNSSSFSSSASEVDVYGFSSESNEDFDLEPDSDCSAYEDSDEETEPLLLPPLLQPFTPIPFAEPQTEMTEWTSGRSKFSCLPSPLSPRHTVARSFSFRYTPPRHLYHQHGYSRHALLHLKWFWASREDDWMDPEDRLRDSKAYGGLSVLGLGPSPVRGQPVPSSLPGQLPPLSIHPRRGDLSALRDPYCMHIDRYFVGLPLWTMAKTLWMFDVHLAVNAPKNGASEPGDQCDARLDPRDDDAKSEAESLDTSTSLHFSDDSDTTLVESDSDSDNSPCLSRSVVGRDDSLWECTQEEGRASSCHPALPHPGNGSSKKPLKRSRHGKTQCKTQIYPESRSPSPNVPWTTCWYRRWDLLMHLVRHDQDNAVTADDCVSATKKKTPRFFIGDHDDDEMASAEDDENDDMDDVLIMVNPLYRAENRSVRV
jgi:hypothetical protein